MWGGGGSGQPGGQGSERDRGPTGGGHPGKEGTRGRCGNNHPQGTRVLNLPTHPRVRGLGSGIRGDPMDMAGERGGPTSSTATTHNTPPPMGPTPP